MAQASRQHRFARFFYDKYLAEVYFVKQYSFCKGEMNAN